MKFIADLHIHSHFSRATARNLDPEHLSIWAQKKGITVVGTGDFTHPGWLSELQEKLVEAENGLYRLRPDLQSAIESMVPESCHRDTRFLLSGEISCIYKRGEKTRKIHHLILMPNMDSVIRFNERLGRIGNLTSDGRPILGLDSRDLLEIVLEVSDRAFFIPAHIWTPWFSLFGSKSGFDSIEECFGDLKAYIHALETGLSSDPPMNRNLSALDGYLLVSNSDAHSPSKLGREANLFDTDLDYDDMVRAMVGGDGFLGTIEFFPEEGKYHLDGHRKCQVRLHPAETRRRKGICPSCGRSLTVGVLHRVVELSDRDTPKLSKEFYSLIPLPEILSEILDCGPSSKKVTSVYEDLLGVLGPELYILMDISLREIETAGSMLLSGAIDRMRRGQVIRLEGYDGEYGTIHLFEEAEKAALSGQMALFRLAKEQGAQQKDRFVTEREDVGWAGSHQNSSDTVVQHECSDPLLDPLNDAQGEAVLYQGDHLLIVAGPGTGKTLTLTHRIAHTIRSGEASPEQVLALTFTRKAARTMRQRISKLLKSFSPCGRELGEVGKGVFVATFHGFCLEVLKRDGKILGLPDPFTVCSELDAMVIARQVIKESGKGERIADRFLKNLSLMKMVPIKGNDKDLVPNDLLPVFRSYQETLRRLGMLDLDDLEVETLRLFQTHPKIGLQWAERFPEVFVDEYQDTNPVQVSLLKTLIQAGHGRICAIGDPDQAIYGFRGADVRNFHRFERDFPGAKLIRLSKNYRSTQFILSGSSALMAKEKAIEGKGDKGDFIRVASCRTHSEEAEMIVEQIEKMLGATTFFSLDSGRVSSHEEGANLGFGDVAVLFRLNIQGDALEEALSRAGIPFIRSGERPLISRYPVNIVWRFLQALRYPDNHYYLKAYLNLLGSESSKGEEILRNCNMDSPLTELLDQAIKLHAFDLSSRESVEDLRRMKEIAEHFDGNVGSFLDNLSLERGIDHMGLSGDRVAIMSLHGAKGLEWPVVFIVGCEDGLIPCTLFGDRDVAEERRLLYVGMTRARRRLILCYASRRMINGRMIHMKPSPFLNLLPEEFCAPLERAKWKRKGKPHKQLDLFSGVSVVDTKR
ncbi:MAG: UvrD-helicase domain-containing protein [Pseudomonadota bacterium]